MRLVALVLALAGAATLAWSYAGAVTVRDDTDEAVQPGRAAAAPILLDEGGLMRPIPNGGRIPLRKGWATVRFDKIPVARQSQLVVTLFDGSGTTAGADIAAEYEALGMDHGRTAVRGAADGGSHRIRLAFEMPGQWKVTVSVTRDGSRETFTLVLPMAGL